MNENYWYITFTWQPKHSSTRKVDHAVHCGVMEDWIVDSLQQPEDWQLTCCVEISREAYQEIEQITG